ncbi:peptidase M61 [Persicitalea jodogahamensis]|uniref:Peptidase M61 n=2 Tax=Persicitalea jodogahamensis TaxID=402147 RepID=A0A8J3D3U9_9BACT|nr:peptidase M61 [Persicitalea jodogahamensis]
MFRFVLFLALTCGGAAVKAQEQPTFHYVVSFPKPAMHQYHVELRTNGWNRDTLQLKMPAWMPGYYQLMNYANNVLGITAQDEKGQNIPIAKTDDNSWVLSGIRQKAIILNYDVKTDRQFVANSYVDSTHAYLIPGNTFLYVDGFLHLPVSVEVEPYPGWPNIVTGLDNVDREPDKYFARDFDILYDCPFLIGNLESLRSFKVRGVEHRFIGYAMGDFDRQDFMDKLAKVVAVGVDIIGDIPYRQYTFIGIGPGRGGIEHLNNTTVSFDGSNLRTAAGMNQTLNFLAHEYFHHYNVKRIRPMELGPFNYDAGSPTNLLWVSEGLTVYYEYLIVKRAGLVDEAGLFADFAQNIRAVENNPGRHFQSLVQASYSTWKDGPFGTQGDAVGKTISYYDKGPVVGMLLDFAIRNATRNEKSLDDVMRFLYRYYYQQQQRGFTDAEFRQACETIAGAPLTELFEYVHTTKELDYDTYLGYAGLKLDIRERQGKKEVEISRLPQPDSLQTAILKSWLGD